MSVPRDGLWDVPGQDRAVGILRGAVARGEVAHAWAFTGPARVGQEEAARALAAALNCSAPARTAADPCGACHVCDRCARGVYPAYMEFAPVGREHRVTDVRDQWLPVASRSVVEGTWKVLRIIDADRMNEAAANAFLKALEEPAPGTVWVLEVADPDELPDTVLSRCRQVRFAAWGPDELEAEAAQLGLEGEDARLAARAALGLPERLHRLAREHALDDYRAHREVLTGLRAPGTQGPAHALVAAHAVEGEVKRHGKVVEAENSAEMESLAAAYGDEPPQAVVRQLSDRAERRKREVRTAVTQAALDDVALWLRDALYVAAGGDAADAVNADAGETLRADADALGPARLLRAADRVMATREELELNAQTPLALEACFLELSALAREWPGRPR